MREPRIDHHKAFEANGQKVEAFSINKYSFYNLDIEVWDDGHATLTDGDYGNDNNTLYIDLADAEGHEIIDILIREAMNYGYEINMELLKND